MGKLLVDVDREALERVRVKLGARSHAEALRKLIETADGSGPQAPLTLDVSVMAEDWATRTLRSKPADTSRAKVTDPGMDKPLKTHFRPNPKPGKR